MQTFCAPQTVLLHYHFVFHLAFFYVFFVLLFVFFLDFSSLFCMILIAYSALPVISFYFFFKGGFKKINKSHPPFNFVQL